MYLFVYTGFARCFFLVKGSFSFKLLPSTLANAIWFLTCRIKCPEMTVVVTWHYINKTPVN